MKLAPDIVLSPIQATSNLYGKYKSEVEVRAKHMASSNVTNFLIIGSPHSIAPALADSYDEYADCMCDGRISSRVVRP